MAVPEFPWTGRVLGLILGVGLMALMANEARGLIALERSGERAQGEVVRVERKSTGDESHLVAVVRFRPADGRELEITGPRGSFAGYSVGERVEVLYDLRDPRHASIHDVFAMWFTPGLFFVVGFAIASLSARGLVRAPQRPAAERSLTLEQFRVRRRRVARLLVGGMALLFACAIASALGLNLGVALRAGVMLGGAAVLWGFISSALWRFDRCPSCGGGFTSDGAGPPLLGRLGPCASCGVSLSQ